MKSIFCIGILSCLISAHASPITLLSDSRYRVSNGTAKYDSSNSSLQGQQSISWDMKANTPFGGMDGFDLSEIPMGYYNWGSGSLAKGMVGMTSEFDDNSISGSGFTSNFLGIATWGPRAREGDSGYARLDLTSHYEITFRVEEAITYDFSSSILGNCQLSFTSNDGFSLQGSDLSNYCGVLDCGIYTILGDATTSMELGAEGQLIDQKRFGFNFDYHAVPETATTGLLLGTGVITLIGFAKRRNLALRR